jgi:hypothetical protein
MRSQALLVALLATPCVVEGALPVTLFQPNFSKHAQLLAEEKYVNSGGEDYLESNKADCNAAIAKMDAKITAGYQACAKVCLESRSTTFATNMAAGEDTPSCLLDDACVKFKATCASDNGWGFGTSQELKYVFEEGNAYKLKASTHSFGIYTCVPKDCEGAEFPDMVGKAPGFPDGKKKRLGTYEAGMKFREGPIYMGSPAPKGVTQELKVESKEMPPPIWFWIVVVLGALLLIGGCAMMCGGGKKPAEKTAPATEAAPAVDEEAAPAVVEEAAEEE